MVEFTGKVIAVVGMARTGMAAAEVLTDLGARVVLFDRKPASELQAQVAQAKRLGVEARAGQPDVDLDGIDILIPSPGVPATSRIFEDAKTRGVEILSEIELAYRISKAPIIAITGTNGKTTTTVLTGRIFEADGRVTYIAGNVAAGEIKLPLVSAAHQASAEAVIVAEISTFQLEWISTFRPKVAMLLNIGTDHVDRHTPEEYAALKARIFEFQRADDYAVINADNATAVSNTAKVSAKKLYFSRQRKPEQGAFIEDNLVKVCLNGSKIACCSLEDIRTSGNLPGTHNQENVMAACCAAVVLGVRSESVVSAVRNFTGVEHRMEKVATVAGVNYINNSMCTNVDAFARSVESVDGRPIVIAGGKHKGGDLAPMAEAVRNHAKHLVLIGASADEIEAAVRLTGFADIAHAGSLEDAVDVASAVAQAGDTVILAPGCASFDMFNNFEHRGDVFKEAVKRRKEDLGFRIQGSGESLPES